MSLYCDCLTLGGGLSAFIWFKQFKIFDTKFEIFELNGQRIKIVLCAADGDVLG
jgi:hypothetical protein